MEVEILLVSWGPVCPQLIVGARPTVSQAVWGRQGGGMDGAVPAPGTPDAKKRRIDQNGQEAINIDDVLDKLLIVRTRHWKCSVVCPQTQKKWERECKGGRCRNPSLSALSPPLSLRPSISLLSLLSTIPHLVVFFVSVFVVLCVFIITNKTCSSRWGVVPKGFWRSHPCPLLRRLNSLLSFRLVCCW